MDKREILKRLDHTLLKQDAVWEQIKEICDEGMKYGVASVCIPPSFVRRAAEYMGGRLPVCTVIGFPNGYATTAVKVFETEDAVRNGADEIDMVIDIGMVKERDYGGVLEEIRAVRRACQGKILKVIIETCLLTDEEKVEMCRVVTESGADYIKTSTGFASGGATFADVKLMREHVGAQVKVKAAGGISSAADAERFIELGADRLGTSRLIRLLEEA
ncbi:MAG TPA: deoxyribose-phosphate aldolase [Candidatus Lachnoclostridium stercoripullorum]|uniref:Deoxyribose-phosphate aldolase n=1 Tax=Candidatus Lachnoclostridium stercoripullorum TaxID=2838635 RepID=A0A9D1W2T7_9FIRM|nr:deoxyribose-phosphate aldolase [Candidatus Lachnoclostridium stercoripullorum]